MTAEKRVKLANIMAKLLQEVAIDDIPSGYSIDFAAKEFGTIHDLVFCMRQKFLIAFADLQEEQCPCQQDVSEMDKAYALESDKGKVLLGSVCRKSRKSVVKVEKGLLTNTFVFLLVYGVKVAQ